MIPFNKPPYTGKETEYLLDAVQCEKIILADKIF